MNYYYWISLYLVLIFFISLLLLFFLLNNSTHKYFPLSFSFLLLLSDENYAYIHYIGTGEIRTYLGSFHSSFLSCSFFTISSIFFHDYCSQNSASPACHTTRWPDRSYFLSSATKQHPARAIEIDNAHYLSQIFRTIYCCSSIYQTKYSRSPFLCPGGAQ